MELGVSEIIYFADNDKSGDAGASKLATRLLQSDWQGVAEFRKVSGPGIPEKGDVNDLLCHHWRDLSAARAALFALPVFQPRIESAPAPKISIPGGDNDPRWDTIKEAVRIALNVTRYNRKGFSKNFSCRIPGHEPDNSPER